MKIPQIIHQIWWQGKDSILANYPDYRQSWIDKHPTYQYMFWDEGSIKHLVSSYPKEVQTCFESLPHMIQKIDMAKFLILFKHGGLYADVDSECLKPFTVLLNSKANIILTEVNVDWIGLFIAYSRLIGKALQNCLMGGSAHHPFWLHCIDLVIQESLTPHRWYETRVKYIFRTTGPGLLTKAYETYPGGQNEINVLPPKITDSISLCDYELLECATQNCGRYFPEAYSMHHYGSRTKGSSWHNEFERNVAIIWCRYSKIFKPLLVVIALVILYLVYKRLFKRKKN
jgi:mannosyltransferase OCH1-like enzyme